MPENIQSDVNCVVCQDIASGVHYGVLACEGCKGFFRRIITTYVPEKVFFTCSGVDTNKCNIVSKVRSNCQRCRLQKCFNVGMTRRHSKLGRKRKLGQDGELNLVNIAPDQLNTVFSDEYLKKRIQEENKFFLREIGSSVLNDSKAVKIKDKDEKCEEKENNERNLVSLSKKAKTMEMEFPFNFQLRNDVLLSPSLTNFWKIPKEALNNMDDDKAMVSPYSPNTSKKKFPLVVPIVKINNGDIDQLFIQMNAFLHQKRRDDPDYLTFRRFRKLVYQAHMETCIVTEPIMEDFFNNKQRNIGTDYDSDNVWEIMQNEMAPITVRVIEFCKSLPDLKKFLSTPDLVNVIKLALFDIISIRYIRLVDIERNQFFDPQLTRKIPGEVMAKNPLGPLFLRYFYVVEFLKREQMDPIDDYEMAYLSALCLTLPGWDSSQVKSINISHLNSLKFFYCLCLYDHILVKKYKGNTYETRRRMRRLYAFLDKIKIVTKTQADLLLSLSENVGGVLPDILQEIYFHDFEDDDQKNLDGTSPQSNSSAGVNNNF